MNETLVPAAPEFEAAKQYWLGQLGGDPPELAFPGDFPRTLEYQAGEFPFSLAPELSSRLLNISKGQDLALFTILLSIFKIILWKYTGQTDLVVAGTVYLEEGEEAPQNKWVLFRDQIQAEFTFQEFLLAVRQTVIGAYENQYYPLRKALESVNPTLKPEPFFRVILLLENIHPLPFIEEIAFSAHNDFTVVFSSDQNALKGKVIYNSKTFTVAAIEKMVQRYHLVCEQILGDFRMKVGEITLLSQAEKAEFIESLSQAEPAWDGKTLIRLFEEQVTRTPEHPALVFGERQLTYTELNQLSNQLAHRLKEIGAGANIIIGVLAERSLAMIIGILGILKTGAAYLPLDPEYPVERIRYILRDSGTQMIVVQGTPQIKQTLVEKVQFAREVLAIDEVLEKGKSFSDLASVLQPGDPAYLIYTSGTTGKPKGVLVASRSISNTICWRMREYGLNGGDRVLQLFAYVFDGFLTSFFTPLVSGATVVLLSEAAAKDPLAIRDAIVQHRITHFISIPALYGAVLDLLMEEEMAYLRIVTLAGDRVTPELIAASQAKKPGLELVNEYGPTEASVAASFQRNLQLQERITIGKSIANTRIFIVDGQNWVQPMGVPGEIYVSGMGLAEGYLNQPELTTERFISVDSLQLTVYSQKQTTRAVDSGQGPEDGQKQTKDVGFINCNLSTVPCKLYKTGDRGRLLPDGTIEFMGRMDHQVKIRGFRIELGEIESRLLGHPEVKEAVVVSRNDANGNPALYGYIVTARPISGPEIKGFLGEKLPDYMIPAYIIPLEKMPLSPNGKINRKELPVPETSLEFTAPRNELERVLAEIWLEILNINRVGIDDHFFDIGGHSLNATILITRIHKKLGVEVPLRFIFKHPTIREIGAYIEKAEKSIYLTIEPGPKLDHYPLSAAQQRMYILHQTGLAGTSYNTPGATMITGEPDPKRLEEVFQQLIKRHEVLRTSFDLVAGEPAQRVWETVDFRMDFTEWRGQGAKDISEAESAALIREFIQPFDLRKPPLLRVKLIRISSRRYLLLYDLHHIISDGVSMGIFVQEFTGLYAGQTLPSLSIQYRDFALWQNRLFAVGRLKLQEEYWRSILEGELPVLTMPLDFQRPPQRSFNGKTIRSMLPAQATSALEKLAQQQNITLNILLFAIYGLLVGKYTGQRELIIGSLVAGRTHGDLENLMGVFMNFLPIRLEVNLEESFTGYLAAAQNMILTAYENQDLPFEMMVEKYGAGVDPSRNPLFDTMFVFHNQVIENLEIAGLQFAEVNLNRETATLDFKMDSFINETGQMVCILEYNTSLFADDSMGRLLNHFEALIGLVLENPEQKLLAFEIFNGEEMARIATLRKNNWDAALLEAKIAVSATFTAEPIGDYIKWWSKQFRVNIEPQFAPYNQVFQEFIDPGSLTSQNPGVNLFLIRFEDWLRDDTSDPAVQIKKLEENFHDLETAFQGRHGNGLYLVGVFPVAAHLNLHPAVEEKIAQLNQRWKKILAETDQVSLIDGAELADLYNIQEVFDPLTDRAGHAPFSDEFYAALGGAVTRRILAWKSDTFKVIVVDCDNTLWKGICGETGPQGVAISEPFLELQRFLIRKSEQGMLLALCSKNNEADVWEVFSQNPAMVLKQDHWVAWRINWEPKPENLKSLARELNLGLESFIYLDDDPVECAAVMSNLPEVLTIQLPEDENQIGLFLKHVWAFDRLGITAEDRQRTAMYGAEKRRQEIREELSLADFIKTLELQVSFAEMKPEQLGRAAQLTQRTNQFNLSTIRRTETEIQQLLEAPGVKCWVVEVADRFGAYGLTGVVISRQEAQELFLDTFLLSCRVLGRRVEAAVLSGLKRYCKESGIAAVTARFIPTLKNQPFTLFLKEFGWEMEAPEVVDGKYRLPVERLPEPEGVIQFYYRAGLPPVTGTPVTREPERPALERPVQSMEVGWGAKKWETPGLNLSQLRHYPYLIALQNHTGKMLLQSVARPALIRKLNRAEYAAPENETERRLIGLLEQLLEIEGIGRNDSFFDLGGHSLKATLLVSRIYKTFAVEVTLGDIFQRPRIRELALYIDQEPKRIYARIQPALVPEGLPRDFYKLSAAQRRIYINSQLADVGTSYNIPGALRINGNLDPEKLRNAFYGLIKRHETLRTSFEIIEGELAQRIHPVESVTGAFQIETWDLTDDTRGEDSNLGIQSIIREFIRPFTLDQPPLLRVGLIRLSSKSALLIYDIHHLIADGVSLQVLVRDFTCLYKGNPLPELPVQYKDFAAWQNDRSQNEAIQTQAKYWREIFTGKLQLLTLPFDYPRPVIRGFAGGKVKFSLDANLSAQLDQLAAKTGSTQYMILLAVYNVLLHKYSGQTDIIVGTPVAGRFDPDLENLIGVFINTLALRNYPSGDMSFLDFLAQVRSNTIEAFENQDYQFDELVRKLQLDRNPGRNPLYDVMFIFQNMKKYDFQIPGLEFEPFELDHRVTLLDLVLTATEWNGKLLFELEYATDLFKQATMIGMVSHFLNIIQVVLGNPDIPIKEIQMLTPEERQNREADGEKASGNDLEEVEFKL